MTQHNPTTAAPVSLSDIRALYPHLPAETPLTSAMHHPAILVFVHDPENAANALGQVFLARNNDFDARAGQPLAVAAEMTGADYKIFDLSPPERQTLPVPESDIALAVSYGMVTIEQGVDFIALIALGQDTANVLPKIKSFDDIATTGAVNIAAVYGAWLAARMGGIALCMPEHLATCIERLATSETAPASIPTAPNDLKAVALNIIEKRAVSQIK